MIIRIVVKAYDGEDKLPYKNDIMGFVYKFDIWADGTLIL